MAMESPWKAARDSPSKQLLWELSRLAVTQQEDLYERLDREAREREAAHKTVLALSQARHEQVRRDAEIERDRLDRLEKQAIQDKERQEAENRREAEARQQEERRRQQAEQVRLEKRRAEERAEAAARAERAATEERNAEIARQQAEKDRHNAEAQRAKKAAQEAVVRRKTEEARRAEQASNASDTRATPKLQPAFPTAQPPGESTARQTRLVRQEAEHQRYLEIHKNLKDLRKHMDQQVKQDPKLKARMGDMRRNVRKSVGQILEGKQGANKKPVSVMYGEFSKSSLLAKQSESIVATLQEAVKSFPQPVINLSNFVARSIPATQGPALLVYLLNHFAKAVVSQFITEAAVAPKVAGPLGTIAMLVFSKKDFLINNISLVDVLIAKFHVRCPPLFGIYGDEKTAQGRTRLGWGREEGGGPWVSDQIQQSRLTGLGAGYAALSLRNFEKSSNTNPYPPYHFWQAVATILNVPAGEVTDTHMYLLRALLMNSETRFLEFFGDAARKLLHIAVVEYPERAAKGSVAAVVLSTLGDSMKRERKLYV
ncbi:MAG: hypothetical protein LQ346_008670 [Caloplaca aetnensis]|nr:MAG: hypothetical protein LQ346_008670 [Caloplaca aetnensis]